MSATTTAAQDPGRDAPSGTSAAIESAALPHVRRWVIGAAALVAVGYFASITVRLLDAQQNWIVTEYVALAGAVVGLVLALAGRVRAGGAAVVGVVWAELHASMLLAQGAPDVSGFPVFPVLIAGTGLLIGGRAAILLAVATAVTAPLCVVAARALGSTVDWPTVGLHGYVVLVATMLASAVMVDQGIKSFRDALWSRVAHEHKYASLAEHSPYGIVVLDGAGRIETLNPAAERLLGLPEDQAQGRPFADALGPASGERVPDLPTAAGPASLEVEVQRGTERRTLEVLGRRMLTEDGTEGTQILLRDVSTRREVERHAVQLGRMLDQALSEVYVFDAETLRLRYVNLGARRNLGYDAGALETLTITDIAPALTRAAVREAMTELSASPDEVIGVAGRHRRKDGTLYAVEARLHLVSFAGGSAIGLFALDVSARPRAGVPHPGAEA